MTDGCLSENTLASLIEGRLDPEARSWVSEHLTRCSDCSDWAAELARLRSDGPSAPHPGGVALPGSRIAHYTIVEHLGHGGNADVYSAFDERLERYVALKLARAAGMDVDSLLAEATALAASSNPNVITVYDAGHVDGRPYLAMERVTGGSLRTWMQASPRSLGEIQTHFLAAGHGLMGAHAVGVVHGDFKPENVLIGDDGRVLVIDFGLSRFIDDEVSKHRGGTWPYLAPEQHRGEPATFWSDQYAFAVSCLEALTGSHPFGDPHDSQFEARVRSGAVARLPRWRPWVRILNRALHPDPKHRYRSMSAMLVRLERWAQLRRTMPLIAGMGCAVATVAVAWPSKGPESCDGGPAQFPRSGVPPRNERLAGQHHRHSPHPTF